MRTLDEIKQSFVSLSAKPPETVSLAHIGNALTSAGNYYLTVLPSNIEPAFVFETEFFLTKILMKVTVEEFAGRFTGLKEPTSEILPLIAAISSAYKLQKVTDDVYVKLHELGISLVHLGEYFAYLAGDPTTDAPPPDVKKKKKGKGK